MELNITAVLYMFFRLSPFMLVCFFSLYSIFNRNLNGIIYLAGLLIACFVTVLIGNFPGFQNFDKTTGLPSRMDQSCRMIEFTEAGPISYLPLGQTILAYTFAYVGIPIIKNDFVNKNFNHVNVIMILFFFLLLVVDFAWNASKQCFGTGGLFISLIIGIAVGTMWYFSLVNTNQDLSLFKTASTAQTCDKDAKKNEKSKNRCRVWSAPYIYTVNSDLNSPGAICKDPEGNIYVSDTGNNLVRKFTVKYTTNKTPYVDSMSILAGNMDLSSPEEERLNAPAGICFDPTTQCVFVADSGKHVIRKISASGTVSIYAGKLNDAGYSGDGNLATLAQLNNPTALYVDKDGVLFVADTLNHVIRKIDTAGIITLFAGNPQKANVPDNNKDDNVNPTDEYLSFLNSPLGVAGDDLGNIYISDTGNRRIRKIGANTGWIGTVSFDLRYSPTNLFVDKDGNIYMDGVEQSYSVLYVFYKDIGNPCKEVRSISDYSMVNKYLPQRNSTLGINSNKLYYVVGTKIIICDIIPPTGDNSASLENKTTIYDTNSTGDGVLKNPQDMCIDPAGENIYIADTDNHVIRKMDSRGNISIFAGTYATATKRPIGGSQTRSVYNSDSTVQNGIFRTQTTFNFPKGICCDANGNIFVADSGNNVIRKIDAQGTVTTEPASFDNRVQGSPTFYFTEPVSVAVDTNGILYVVSSNSSKIFQINNTASVFADKGTGTTLKKMFISPKNELYVTGTTSAAGKVYKITNDTTPQFQDYMNGSVTLSTALSSVFIDNQGKTYITDDNLKISNDSKSIHTTYGTKTSTAVFDKNNIAAGNAHFTNIVSSVTDRRGNIFVLDAGKNTVCKIYTKMGSP